MNRSRVEQHTKIQAHNLERAAYVYVRQSSPRQVHEHLESPTPAVRTGRVGIRAGWARERILVIDEDQGKSGQLLGLVRDRADPRRDEGIRRDQSARGQRDAQGRHQNRRTEVEVLR